MWARERRELILTRTRRIAAIVEYFPPRLGGDRRIFELLRVFPRDRFEVFFIVVPPSFTLFMTGIQKEAPRSRRVAVEQMHGIIIGYPATLLSLWRRSLIVSHLATLVCMMPKVIRILIELRPDLVVVNNTSAYTGILGYLGSRLTGCKFLADFNDFESEYTAEKVGKRVPRAMRGIVRLSLRLVEDIILKGSGKITTHTHILEEYTRLRFNKEVVYIPDGVNTYAFSPTRISESAVRRLKTELGLGDKGVCVYAGRIDENIGGALLYEVLKLLQKEANAIRCVVVGEGSASLVAEIRKLSTAVFVGLKPPSDVPRYIAAADVVLVPYPLTRSANTVSPLKLFEALAMAKPVIASDLSGIRDVIVNGHNGILVGDNPEEWVQSITQVISNKDLARRLSENGQATAKGYEWRSLSRTFQSVVESILESK